MHSVYSNHLSGLNMDHICKQLIRFNNHCLVSQKLCDLNDVIDVMNNKHRLKGEKKIRVQVRKVKLLKSLEVLNDRYNDKIYHCILENHHAVVFYKQYIFDPIFKNALPRSIKYSQKKHVKLSFQYCFLVQAIAPKA